MQKHSTPDPCAEMCNPLMTPDIFYSILDCFCPEKGPARRRALFSLAQTCRAFSEPSLDYLWSKLRSLRPLIRCYTGLNEVKNGALVPPTPSEFSIIDKYSHRVLELIIEDDDSLHFLQSTSLRPSCLLPNLRVLQFNTSIYSYMPILFIRRLLSPTLVSLQANLSETDQATLLSFFDAYPLLCRSLKSIEFSFSASPKTKTTTQALSRAICGQEMLESVILRAPIDRDALAYLCTLPTLKVLSAHLSECSRLQTGTFLPTDPLFHSAEELEFITSKLDLVTSLLRPRDQTFHTFRLHLEDRVTSEAVATFWDLLASRSQPKPIQNVTFSPGNFFRPMQADEMASQAVHYRISYNTLEPLMTLRSLRVLNIEWSEQISLDDKELASLARNWPLLRVFYFYCGRGGYPPFTAKYATLLGLLSLVDSCPDLHTVGLPLDARLVPEVKDTKARKTSFDQLTLPESPIGEVLAVAEFLFKYLPSVTVVEPRFLMLSRMDNRRATAYEEAWFKVQTYLDEFHSSSE